MAHVAVLIIIAIGLRLSYHKYTDETVYAINPFVVIVIFLLELMFFQAHYLSFLIGFFLIDFVYYILERCNQESKLKNVLARLLSLLPDRKDENVETNLD